MKTFTAVGVSDGVSMGNAYILPKKTYKIPGHLITDTGREIAIFDMALDTVIQETKSMLSQARRSRNKIQADILNVHLMLLEDTTTTKEVYELISQFHLNAVWAVQRGMDSIVTLFRDLQSEYMQERAEDIVDIQIRLIHELLGIQAMCDESIPPGSIIIADELSISDAAKIDLSKVAGIITKLGGKNSHTSIIIRNMEIPAVIGAENVLETVANGDEILLDAEAGEVIIHPTKEISEEFNKKQQVFKIEKQFLKTFINAPTTTKDGIQVDVMANITVPDEVSSLLENNAGGIGLFRSEFLVSENGEYPDLQTQFEAYRNAALVADGKPVVIRTMDLGADKPYLPIMRRNEDNPALGYRAIRVQLDNPDYFMIQLKAILMASHYGVVHINFPMISSLDELRQSKALLEIAKQELTEENIPFNKFIPVGVMLETPAAIMIADHLAQECDFFSIGSNDLAQYSLAVDRCNEKVSHLYTEYHPGVLKLISYAISAARSANIPCCLCGEVSGDPLLVPALFGMGLRCFSTSPSRVLKIRSVIPSLTAETSIQLAQAILSCPTAEDVYEKLSAFSSLASSFAICG